MSGKPTYLDGAVTMAPVTDLNLARTLDWVRNVGCEAVPKHWVPGATDEERRGLQALASIAGHLLPRGEPPATWPDEINGWLRRATSLPLHVGEELDLAVKENGDEALAYLYAAVVAAPHRRVLGTFFTPDREVTPMLEMWDASQPSPSEVVDVGAGVGVFTAAAAGRWPNAGVAAVDVNPVALGLLGARMALADVNGDSDRVELVLEDFTAWLPAQHQGVGRLVLGNPPYTRGQLIPSEDRQRLLDASQGLCGSRASLSAFIMSLALTHLGSNDGLCLLLPAQWLESNYAAGLRRHLLGLKRRHIELRIAPAELFSDAVVDAVVLLVGTEATKHQPFVVSDWSGQTLRTIDRQDAPLDGWRSWFKASGVTARPVGAQQLSDVVTLRRGTATGANEFFCLSDEAVADHSLPSSALKPLLRRLWVFDTDRITGSQLKRAPATERKWLLVATREAAQDPAVAAYIQVGISRGFDQRHLCKVRSGPWFDVTHDLVVPDVVITAMSRDRFRIVENAAGAAITNNLYGWKWRRGVSSRTRATVLDWLRGPDGQAEVKALCRSQGGGLAKIEPASLARLLLPAELFVE